MDLEKKIRVLNKEDRKEIDTLIEMLVIGTIDIEEVVDYIFSLGIGDIWDIEDYVRKTLYSALIGVEVVNAELQKEDMKNSVKDTVDVEGLFDIED